MKRDQVYTGTDTADGPSATTAQQYYYWQYNKP